MSTPNSPNRSLACLREDLLAIDDLLTQWDADLTTGPEWIAHRNDLVRLGQRLADIVYLPPSVQGYQEREEGSLRLRIWRARDGQTIYIVRNEQGVVIGATEHKETVHQLSKMTQSGSVTPPT